MTTKGIVNSTSRGLIYTNPQGLVLTGKNTLGKSLRAQGILCREEKMVRHLFSPSLHLNESGCPLSTVRYKRHHQFIHPFSSAFSRLGSQGGWSLSLLPWGERLVTPWRDCQSDTGLKLHYVFLNYYSPLTES